MTTNGVGTPELLDAAVARHRAGDLAGAERIYNDILAGQPDHADALYLLGTIRHQQSRHHDAMALLNKALALKPRLIAAHNNLGKVYDALGRWDEAVACFDRALAINPDDADSLCNLGIAEAWRGHSAAGEAALRRSIALNPKSHAAVSGLGYVLYHQGRTDEAVAAWTQAAAMAPDFVEAHINLGTAYLMRMDFIAGWREFAWRNRLPDSRIDTGVFPQRRWRGEDLTGQSLLLVGEQGLGDQILAANPIPFMLARNIKLVIECEPRLKPLFARSFAGADVVAAATPPRPPTQDKTLSARGEFFDLAATLIRSPTGFIPHRGYLKADPARTDALRTAWRHRAGANRLIGISWNSARVRLGAAKSSQLVRDWADVLGVPGNTFVSLQYGNAERELKDAAAAGLTIHREPSVDPTTDIDGLAALTAAMDLVISVSNTTVHLAGALNVPVWTIVPAGPGRLWYWFERRADSPWYPSMRLFRQDTYGVWPQVMAEVATALRGLPSPVT